MKKDSLVLEGQVSLFDFSLLDELGEIGNNDDDDMFSGVSARYEEMSRDLAKKAREISKILDDITGVNSGKISYENYLGSGALIMHELGYIDDSAFDLIERASEAMLGMSRVVSAAARVLREQSDRFHKMAVKERR